MIFGLAVFALYLYFFVGFNQLFLVVKNVDFMNYITYYLLAIGTMLLVMLCWVSSWRKLLASLKIKISLKNAFLYYWIGYFVDLVVPCQAVCGEVTRLYLVHKETRDNYGAIAAAGITNRIVAYTIVTLGLSVGTIYVLTKPDPPLFALELLFLSWIGALAYLVVLLYLAFKDDSAEKLAAVLMKVLRTLRVRRYSEGLSPKTLESLKSFNEGFKFFRANPRHLIVPIIFQVFSFTLNLTVYIFVFYALGLGRTQMVDFFVVVYFLAGAIQDASAAFSVGALEILLTNIFIFYGIEAAVSGVAAAVLRSVTFWFPLLVGYIIAQVVGVRRLISPGGAREYPSVEPEVETDKPPVSSAGTSSS